jgi:membrane peptidoglycan carboxypeptidase
VDIMAADLDTRSARRPARPARRRRRRRPWWARLLVVVIAVVILLAGGLLMLLAGTPSAADAPARVQAILAAHSAPGDGGRVPVKVGAAVLATEDSRYRSDWAVDPRGALRASWGLITHNPDEGGATIEVQLAKLLYTPKRSDPVALAEQVAIAVKLDRDFSKTRILALYLDAAYYGDGAYGVTAAAEHYFGVAPDRLTWGQAAMLAGLVQAPTAFNPHLHLHAALVRRSEVLGRLVAVGTLTSAQARAAAAAPLHPAVSFAG